MVDVGLLTFPKITKVVLLGGGNVCRHLVDSIREMNLELVVITSPRHALESNNNLSLKEFLESRNIDFHIFESINIQNLRDALGNLEKSLCLSLGAAWVFTEQIISTVFANRLLNSHGTRLPQNRGGGGFSWQVLTSNRFGFVTLHLVDAGIDTGPIVAQKEFLYPASCRIPAEYQIKSDLETIQFLKSFISLLSRSSESFQLHYQQQSMSTYWPRLNSGISAWIDWGLDPVNLDRFICAFDDPYEGSKTTLNKRVVRIKTVALNFEDGVFHPYQSGLVYRVTENWICVALSGASLIIQTVNDDFGRSILSEIEVGDRFETPHEMLDDAKKRISYTPTGLRQ
jgi:methionyl-tRNA formyltransferase